MTVVAPTSDGSKEDASSYLKTDPVPAEEEVQFSGSVIPGTMEEISLPHIPAVDSSSPADTNNSNSTNTTNTNGKTAPISPLTSEASLGTSIPKPGDISADEPLDLAEEMDEEILFMEDGEPYFPVEVLEKLDEMIGRTRWIVPVLPKAELEQLLDAAIHLAKKDLDTRSSHCQRFIKEGLTHSFLKIFTDEAVTGWKYEIQKCIYKSAHITYIYKLTCKLPNIETMN